METATITAANPSDVITATSAVITEIVHKEVKEAVSAEIKPYLQKQEEILRELQNIQTVLYEERRTRGLQLWETRHLPRHLPRPIDDFSTQQERELARETAEKPGDEWWRHHNNPLHPSYRGRRS